MEAKQKAKEEKKQRKQEKNRRERRAYRERQRAKQWGTQPSASRNEWAKKEEPRQEKNEKRKKKARGKGERRSGNNPSTSQVEGTKVENHQPTLKHQTRWESTMEKALRLESFESMQRLFEDRLLWNLGPEVRSARRRIIQNFRELSTKYHPDRNKPEHAGIYKIAFQALNEAKSVCQERYLD